jgi:GNAT superfamily N-acetyltransferase
VIRVATLDDLPLVFELFDEFAREIPDAEWRDDDTEDDLRKLEEGMRRGELVLLADDVGLAVTERRGARVGYVHILYVRQEARRTGVAAALMRETVSQLRARGADVLELDVLASNAGARAVYERWGLEPVELTLAAPLDTLERRIAERPDGPTFGVVHVQTDDVETVRRDAAKVLRAEVDVRLEGGWIRVRSDATDADPARLKRLAKELSYTSGVVLALGVERGSVVRYNLFDRGADVDEYLSVPEFYGELAPGDVYAMGANATVVARLTGADPRRVRETARTASSPAELPAAQQLYEQIAAVLGVEP